MKVMPIGLGHLFFEGENMYKKIDLVSIVTHTIANWSAKKDGTKAFLKLYLNHYQWQLSATFWKIIKALKKVT